jgi:hypothetical protein
VFLDGIEGVDLAQKNPASRHAKSPGSKPGYLISHRMSASARTGVDKCRITIPNGSILMLNKIPGDATEVSVMDNCPL